MMGAPLLTKLLTWGLAISVNVEDKPNGHLRVSVLGIPFYDSERQERRLARRRARRTADKKADGQCAADKPDKT